MRRRWRIGLPGACEHWWLKCPGRGLTANQIACALISMMARSKCFNQRPDTLMQDRSPPARRNHLQRTAGPYIGSFATEMGCPRHVRLPPVSDRTADIAALPKSAMRRHPHQITSMARWRRHFVNFTVELRFVPRATDELPAWPAQSSPKKRRRVASSQGKSGPMPTISRPRVRSAISRVSADSRTAAATRLGW